MPAACGRGRHRQKVGRERGIPGRCFGGPGQTVLSWPDRKDVRFGGAEGKWNSYLASAPCCVLRARIIGNEAALHAARSNHVFTRSSRNTEIGKNRKIGSHAIRT